MVFVASYLRSRSFLLRVGRWHWRNLCGRNPGPLVAGIYLTNDCPHHCTMCTIWRSQPKQYLDPAYFREWLAVGGHSLAYLSFSGGEPLLHPQLIEFVALAAARVPLVHLVTHGSGLTPALARELSRAGLREISFSVDGNREWHNQVRGAATAYDEAMAAIACIREHAPKLAVVVNTVVFPERLDQARAAISFAAAHGLRQRLQPRNVHFTFNGVPAPAAPEWISSNPNPELTGFVTHCLTQRHLISSRYFLRKMADYFRGTLRCDPIRPHCRVPRFFIEMTPTGSISPCLFGSGWETAAPLAAGEESPAFPDDNYRQLQARLANCRRCDTAMYICCWEPPLYLFPGNWIRYAWR